MRRLGTAAVAGGVAALLVAVAAGCGSSSSAETGDGADASVAAACAAVVVFEGDRYLGTYTAFVPVAGARLGSGTTPACADTPAATPGKPENVEVFELEGVSPDVAITSRGGVFIRDGVDVERMPATLTRLLHPPSCVPADEPIELTGRWLGIIGADGHTELDLNPPYDVRVQVAESSAGRYERAELTIRVPEEAGHPLDRIDVRTSLWEQGTISATVRCREGAFVAETVDAEPPRQP
jgi:Family of unknown function (DUF6281)